MELVIVSILGRLREMHERTTNIRLSPSDRQLQILLQSHFLSLKQLIAQTGMNNDDITLFFLCRKKMSCQSVTWRPLVDCDWIDWILTNSLMKKRSDCSHCPLHAQNLAWHRPSCLKNTGWWLQPRNIWKSVGMIRNPIYGKIKLMFLSKKLLLLFLAG